MCLEMGFYLLSAVGMSSWRGDINDSGEGYPWVDERGRDPLQNTFYCGYRLASVSISIPIFKSYHLFQFLDH